MNNEIVRKIEHYCAYQERSHKEVRTKLLELGSRGSELEEMIAHLIEHDFLDEERFASAFARGKFKLKMWGRKKIVKELKAKGVSDYLLKKSLKAIDFNEYYDTVRNLMIKKFSELENEHYLVKKKKVYHYLMSKGYEHSIINECFKDLGL